MPPASSHYPACLKQKLPVDDKMKGRHGNRDFFFFLSQKCGHHGEKREGNTEEEWNRTDEKELQRVKETESEVRREREGNLQDPRKKKEEVMENENR